MGGAACYTARVTVTSTVDDPKDPFKWVPNLGSLMHKATAVATLVSYDHRLYQVKPDIHEQYVITGFKL